MPFDGIVTKCMAGELSEALEGGRVERIFQPEADEIILHVRAKGQNLKLLLSASASYPRIHFTDSAKENPSIPPVFCMLLRKHLSGGKFVGVLFHDYERILTLLIESTNEMGDTSVKKLVIEIMGRHSNIILINSEDKIIDSIKHVDNEISSVREVMPARAYILPPAQDKISPDALNVAELLQDNHADSSLNMEKFLLDHVKGFSPMLCREVLHLSCIDGRKSADSLTLSERDRLARSLGGMLELIRKDSFEPCIIYEDEAWEKPFDFHALKLSQFPYVKSTRRYIHGVSSSPQSESVDISMSLALDTYYAEKDRSERLKFRKADILKVLQTSLERCRKKLSIQQEKLREVSDREKLQLFGELITANLYRLSGNISSAHLLNYYSEEGEFLDIPMDENLSPGENAQRYFKRYAKAKVTFVHTSQQVEDSRNELEYLESVLQLLDNCNTLQEISEVRQELHEQGYISRNGSRGASPAKTGRRASAKGRINNGKGVSRKKDQPSPPIRYLSSDGMEILVGKNNRQNDQLTLKTASSNDIWLHTKEIPGSHVIIRKQLGDIPDTTLTEAAVIAAYHSKAKNSSNVPVDYTQVRNVKKPSGAKPGMVIYDSQKTLYVTPDEKKVDSLRS